MSINILQYQIEQSHQKHFFHIFCDINRFYIGWQFAIELDVNFETIAFQILLSLHFIHMYI